jgi:outer membrane cobalamin receptor
MKPIIAILLFLLALPLCAQTELKGRVIDQQGAPIPGANVYIEGSYNGSFTDENGHFQFKTTASGVQTLIVSFLSYETFKKSAELAAFSNIVVKLKESVNALDAVVITAGTFEAGDKARVSVLKPLDIVTTASAAGDIIGALTTLPGTQVVGEDGRLFVRGGEANETQTFVDGIRVPQPYSPTANNLPTRSRFSPFLFSGVSFSTGGYSAEYGEALSSVLTLNTVDEGSQNQTDISLMTVGLGVGNTRKWEKQSVTFNLAYINLGPYQKIVPQAVDWNKPVRSAGGEMVYRYHFKNGWLKAYGAYDVTNLDINEEDINQPEKQRIVLRNANAYGNLSYKGTLGEDWIIQTGLSYGSGGNQISIEEDKVSNTENALHMKLKLTRIFSDRVKLFGGMDYFYTDFDEEFRDDSGLSFPLAYANHLGAAYLETDIFFSKKLAMKVGVRASRNELLNEFHINPRASMAYKVSSSSQFSLAFGDFVQTPNTNLVKYNSDLRSEEALHYILNYQYNKNGRLLRAEAYYKDYRNLVKFNTEQPQFNSLYNNNGNGFAQGLDIFWRDGKTFRNTDYWISYSYIDAEKDYLNFPVQATPSFIANHTLSVVTKHWIDKLTSQIGFSYTINSGRPFYNPNENGFMTGRTKPFQSLSFNWAYLISQQKILYCSVSNILGTENIFGYQYAHTPDMSGQFQRRAIGQPADRFFFVGFFWTISDDKERNQLDNL